MEMKRLYLVRHASAKTDRSGMADFDRELDGRGCGDAAAMARLVAGQGVKPDLLVSSPAARAIGTAEAFARALGYPEEAIRLERAIYEGGVDDLMDVVRRLPDACGSVMLFGHNPSISLLLERLTGERHHGMATASVALLAFGDGPWAGMTAGCGSMAGVDAPGAR